MKTVSKEAYKKCFNSLEKAHPVAYDIQQYFIDGALVKRYIFEDMVEWYERYYTNELNQDILEYYDFFERQICRVILKENTG